MKKLEKLEREWFFFRTTGATLSDGVVRAMGKRNWVWT